MNKRITTLLMAGLLAIGFTATVAASEISEDSAGNVFASGDAVSLPASQFFGGFAAGKEVEMNGSEAEGSVYIAGQSVKIADSVIDESLFAAGEELNVNDTDISGNVFAAGKTIDFSGKNKSNSF